MSSSRPLSPNKFAFPSLCQPLGNFTLGVRSGDPSVLQAAKQKSVVKFKESCWKLSYYLTMEVYALAITHPEPWFTSTAAMWEGWPGQVIK